MSLKKTQERLFAKCAEIMAAKNHDYAGDGDELANFRMCGQFGIPIEQGIFVRLLDKVARIGNFLKQGELKVTDEKLEDTICDLINYAVILKEAIGEKNA